MEKSTLIGIVLFIIIVIISLLLTGILQISSPTGNVVNVPKILKSEADVCADKFFDCVSNCPSSTLSSSYVSHRCFKACSGSLESCGNSVDMNKLSSDRNRKISCLSSCGTITGTIKRECTNNCLN